MFEGTPTDLVTARSTLTGQHLAKYVAVALSPHRTVLVIRRHMLAV